MEIAEVAGALEPPGTQQWALLVTSGETGRTDEAVLCLANSEEKENCNKLQG